MASSLTPQQHAAITTRGSIRLSAGAGCGKTFVLTKRFLTHLEHPGDRSVGDPLSQVVAITFTDRAAREMRDRIRSECAKELETCPKREVPHWLSILRRIDAARISTIHAFCAGFLRRHAVDAGVDPQFRQLEDETGAALVRASISRTIRRLLEAGDENCLTLVIHYGLEGTQSAVRKLAAGRALVDAAGFRDRDADWFQQTWNAHLENVFIPRLIRDFGDSHALVAVLDLLRDNSSTNAVMQQRRALLLQQLELLRNRIRPFDVAGLSEIREAAQVQGGGGKSAWSSEEIYGEIRDSFKLLREKIDKLKEFTKFSPANNAQPAELTAAAVSVVEQAAADLNAAKREAGFLDFDDLLLRTRDLLKKSKRVRDETSGSIAALLVDEFQDTDPVQAQIVQFLIGGSRNSGKLFVVGDARQSIYRFRGADRAVFDKLRDDIPPEGCLPLSRNFRSQPAILNFVNALFAAVMKEGYEPLVPHLKQVSPTPGIEFLFACPESDEEDSDRADDRRRREADWMVRRIQLLLDDPTPRIAEKHAQTGEISLRPVRAGDIAILFRALSDIAIYEDVFRRRGIEYYLVGGRAFFAQQEVYDLVNLCTFLNDPDDAISLVGILRSPFFSFSDDTLFALSGGEGSLRDALEVAPPSHLPEPQQELVRQASRVLTELLQKKDRLSLAALLQLAVERTGYDASLLHEFLGRRKVANLRKLFEMARQFDEAGLGTLSDFAQRLRDSVAEESVEELAATHPETSNVVRMMTVHQAKGLEFPVVIVADMDRTSRGALWEAVYDAEFGPLLPPPAFGEEDRRHLAIEMRKYVDDREDEEESLRILYVALTRAADHLILSAGLPPDRRVKSGWLQLLAERFDLGTGLPKGDPYFGTSSGTVSAAAIPAIRVHLAAPEMTVARQPKPRQAPLTRFREIVESGEAAPLPRLMQPVAAAHSARAQLSVSRIEQADALLREATGTQRPAASAVTAADSPDREDATVLGTVVHSVIEHLEHGESQPIAAIVEATLKSLSPSDAESISAEAVTRRVQAFVDSDLWSEMNAAERCFRELDFLLRWPVDAAHERETAIISGKIDCLFKTRDGAWKVFDYKTGHVPQGDPAALLEHFSIQLVLYAEAVRAMTGQFPDSLEIVAISDGLRRFPLAMWREFHQAVTHRIDAAIRYLSDGNSP